MSVCVVIPLSGQLAETVSHLRSEISSTWKLASSHPPGLPHVTLVTIEEPVDVAPLRSALESNAAGRRPFRVSGAGFGFFVGRGAQSSVIHLAVTRSPELSSLQDGVVRAVDGCGGTIDGQTRPEFWRPHVTVADSGLDPPLVGKIMEYLARAGPRHWTIEVRNISLVTTDGTILDQVRLGSR